MGPLLRVLQAAVKVSTRLYSHLEALTGIKSASELIQVVGRIHFLVVGQDGRPTFLLEVSWRLPTIPRDCLLFLAMLVFPTQLFTLLKSTRRVSRVSPI